MSTPARRAILCALIGALLTVPLGTQAQPAGKVYRIGILGSQSPAAIQAQLSAFKEKLRDLGYVEGRNVVFESRWANGKYERLTAMAKEMVRLNPDLILTAGGTPSALAAKAATKTIPILFFSGDAVESGLVASLARPGGNLTGFSALTAGLDSKRLEILKEAVPTATRMAILWNPDNPTGVPQRNQMTRAAESLGVQIRMLDARSPGEIDDAFATLTRERVDGMLILSDPMLDVEKKRIIDFALGHHVPAAAFFRTWTESGLLLSYGVNPVDSYRRLAIYADRILRGAKPADLPVEEPTKYELVINLKTARALRLTIPPSLAARADELIQ